MKQRLNDLIGSREVKGPLLPQLTNRLTQVEHHLNGNRMHQAIKHLQKFQQPLQNDALKEHVSEAAKQQLLRVSDSLLEKWS